MSEVERYGMAGNQDRRILMEDLPAKSLKILSGNKSSRLGFASQYLKDVDCVQAAFTAGINYFFSYNLLSDQLLGGLKPLLTTHRDAILVATRSESREPNTLQHYLAQVRRSLGRNIIDAFFSEYLSPQDSAKEVETILTVLQRWKTEGWIRYVGASTHNGEIALELIEHGGWDVLMLCYNMAHRKAESQVLPATQSAGLPVIAFTCTRWSSLLKGHPQWHEPTPTAADCYRYALSSSCGSSGSDGSSEYEPVRVKPVWIKCSTFGERRD